MGFSPPVIPKAFFAYVLGSKSCGGANLAHGDGESSDDLMTPH